MIYALIGIGYVIDVIFIVHDNEKHDGLSILLKTLASLCFVTLAIILSKSAVNKELANYLVYALIADLFGDFILILRNITDKKHDLIFVSGTVCFFIGHIFLMIMLYINSPNVLLNSFILTTIAFVLVGAIFVKALEASKPFMVIGGVYVYFIMFILFYALCSLIKDNTLFDLSFLFGYFLFVVSDIVLILQKFNKKASNVLQPIYRLSYFISQILIALSIARL